jgi:hypothetical protein
MRLEPEYRLVKLKLFLAHCASKDISKFLVAVYDFSCF